MRDLPAEDVETLERAAEILEGMLEERREARGSVSAAVCGAASTPSPSPTTAATSPASSSRSRAPGCRRWPRSGWSSRLTGSGVAVGLTTALQFLPMLLFGAWGGLLADRFPKRRLLMVTQALMAIPALGLFARHRRRGRRPVDGLRRRLRAGTVNAVDNPTRQSFAIEMVGADRVVNAVSLNSVIVQSARIVGPAIAGLLIAAGRRRALLRAQRPHLRRR